VFKPIELDPYKGFYYLKSKEGKELPGDSIWFDVRSEDKLSLILCDGVSSSESDSKASQMSVERLSELVKSKRVLESLKKDLIITLDDLNHDLLSKNLSTTLCFFSGNQDENVIATSGDSALLILDQDRNVIFYNNIYNLKHSSEGVFEVPDGREHMLITCLGHYSSRFEVSSDIMLPKNFEIITFSDGVLQYVDSMKSLFTLIDVMKEKGQDFSFPDANMDDVSLIYVKK
jgi:serine/threonine protein phosphatase PrpC